MGRNRPPWADNRWQISPEMKDYVKQEVAKAAKPLREADAEKAVVLM
jgi:hypothetical protein